MDGAPNFLTKVYVDGTLWVGKQLGPMSDPNYYVVRDVGFNEVTSRQDSVVLGLFPSEEEAKCVLEANKP